MVRESAVEYLLEFTENKGQSRSPTHFHYTMNETLTQLNAYLIEAERIPVAILSIVITMVVGMITGPLRGNANPFFWQFYDLFFGTLGDRLDKPQRPRGDLIFRGFILTVFGVVMAFMIGRVVQRLTLGLHDHGATEVFFLCLSFTSGSVWFVLLRLYFAMDKQGSAKGAFYGLSRSTRFNLNSTDDFGITRAGMGFAAVSFDKGMVAPVLWYLVGGIPVLAVYNLLCMLVWRFGKCGHTTGFGVIPLALEKLMGFIPAYLTGFLFAAASALTPTARLTQSLLAWWAVKNKAPYEQGGPMLAALAWPLGIMIGGPVRDLSGFQLKNVWVGPEKATARLDHRHLRRGIYINFMAHLLFLASLGGAYFFSGRLF